MDVEMLKKQVGKNILNSCDEIIERISKVDNRINKDYLILKNGKRRATIILNQMDLYDIILKTEDDQEIKEDVSNMDLRSILNEFFNFSMLQAKINNDDERLKEIDEKMKNEDQVRII